MTQSIVGGFFQALVWRVNALGIAIGNATSLTPSAGSVLHAYRIPWVSNAALNNGELTPAEYFESDSVGDQLAFGDTRLRTLQVTLETEDDGFLSWLHGMAVDTTYNSALPHYGNEGTALSLPQIGIMLCQMGKNVVSGARIYRNLVAPLCTGTASEGTWGYQAKKTIDFNLVVHRSTRDLHGYDFADMTINAANGALNSYKILSNLPMALTTNIGDGIAQTFQTQYLPASDVVTVNASPNHFAINSIPTAPTSFSTADGTLTKQAIGAANDIESILYEVPEHFPLAA